MLQPCFFFLFFFPSLWPLVAVFCGEEIARIKGYSVWSRASLGPCLLLCGCLKAWFKGGAQIKAQRMGAGRQWEGAEGGGAGVGGGQMMLFVVAC